MTSTRDQPSPTGRAVSTEKYVLPAPTEPVGAKFIASFAFAQLAIYIALLGPVTVSMAIKVTEVVGEDRATSAQGLVLGVGALAAALANPICGRLSDRTMSRWGRRRPWMVGGSLALAAALLLIAVSNSVALLVIGWFLAQFFANAALAAYLATVADQVPVKQSATITSLAGVMQNVGVLASIWLAGLFTSNMIALFMVPAIIGVAGMLIYSLAIPDMQLPSRPPREGFKAVLSTFWVNPKRYPDFAWAWISRFLMGLGIYMFLSFRFLWMRHELGLSEQDAVDAVFIGVLIYTTCLVVVGQTSGWLSDKLGRRKILVFTSTAVIAVGLYLLVHVSSVGGFYLVEGIMGAGYGMYMGVDLALVLAVLPNREDAAKDLGVFNIANAAPQSLAPLLGAGLLAIGVAGGGGDNYTLMYIVAAVITFSGALAIIPVKGVR